MKVHILASIRSDDLLPAATLVFKSLRVGFPTAEVSVHLNGWCGGKIWEEVMRACNDANVNDTLIVQPKIDHHLWISRLIHNETEPFWICDTDMVFFGNMEQFRFGPTCLVGRYIPKFRCAFTRSVTMPRLHTCLLRIDPGAVKRAVGVYNSKFPDCYATPRPTLEDLVFPRYIPNHGTFPYFFDTCSLLYQAIGGVPFYPQQQECFEHLNSGTLSDLVAKAYPEYRLRETHFSIFENPELARGCGKMQDKFYADHAC